MAYQLWRKEEPELDEKGRVVKGGMWPHQRLWWESPSFIKALVAGYGGGKSFCAAKRAIALALVNAPCPHLWVSPTYKAAKRTTVPLLRELMDGKRTIDSTLTYKENKSDHMFTIYHRGRVGHIWIYSGEEPNSIKGPTAGSATIDEPFIQEKDVFDQIIARVRDPRAKRQEIGLVGTPEQLNWGYDVCEGEEAENYDVDVIHASTRDNKAIPQSYADRMEKAYDEKVSRAYVGGQFIDLSHGTVYYSFTRNLNIADFPDPGGELEVGMDFNVNPMAAIVFWRNGPHMHVVMEIEQENADTEYLCSLLREIKYKSGPLAGECRVRNVYPDASGKSRHTNAPGGKSDFHFITDAGFTIYAHQENPKVRDRENAINAKLKPYGGRVPTLTISPRCKKLIKYLHTYTHENRAKANGKAMSHLIDAFGYPVAYLYPVAKPVFQAMRFQGA